MHHINGVPGGAQRCIGFRWHMEEYNMQAQPVRDVKFALINGICIQTLNGHVQVTGQSAQCGGSPVLHA